MTPLPKPRLTDQLCVRKCVRMMGSFYWAKEATGTAKTVETMIAEIRYFTMTYLRRLFFRGDKQISFRVGKHILVNRRYGLTLETTI